MNVAENAVKKKRSLHIASIVLKAYALNALTTLRMSIPVVRSAGKCSAVRTWTESDER